jgi:hypothetical protein
MTAQIVKVASRAAVSPRPSGPSARAMIGTVTSDIANDPNRPAAIIEGLFTK